MAQQKLTYPIVATEGEQFLIDNFMSNIDINIKRAKSQFSRIQKDFGRRTKMVKTNRTPSNLFGLFKFQSNSLNILKPIHYRNVLTVAHRFNWDPAAILAL